MQKYEWIELLNLSSHRDRNFAAKVSAVNAGLERIKSLEYEVIGNLDSDVSFDPDHFEFLMKKFQDDPSLGVAGTDFSRRWGIIRERTALKGRAMWLVVANFFGVAVSKILADISPIEPAASIGSRSLLLA